MRVILDTNTLISAFLWGGNPLRLLLTLESIKATLLTTDTLLDELQEVLERPKFTKQFAAKAITPNDVMARYRKMTTLVSPAIIPSGILGDPDDETILSCAIAGKADYIVSGDGDLLDVQVYETIPIITVTECLKLIDNG